MQYDANGIRCSKTIPTSTQPNVFRYIYDGNNLVRETKSGTSSYTKTFLYNSQGIIGFAIGSTVYTYRKNLFGDIIAIYQGATKKATYLYDAWGNCTITQDTDGIGTANPFRYRGYYWDNDLQLYYLMSRYYDPQTGRFINADSLEYLDPETIGGLNLYSYCGNNPVMHTDPMGTEWNWSTFWKGLGMVATAIGAIALSVTTFGAGIPLAMSIIAGITLGAGVLTGINGVATMIEADDGYNFVRDGLFNDVLELSDESYDIYAGITEGIAIAGSAILGVYHTTGQYKAAKYGQKFLGPGYKKAGHTNAGTARYVSKDGMRQMRFDRPHMYKGKQVGKHMNLEIFKGNKPVPYEHVFYKWFKMWID